MNRNKVLKVIFSIAIIFMLLAAIYNISAFFTKGKQSITVKAMTTYYSGSDINATVSVKKVKNDKKIDAKIIAELYDKDNKKVKGVKEKYNIEAGEEADVSLELPENLETGNYTLKITSKSGLLKDTAEFSVNVIKNKKSNVVISLDKGIYKPGDEINFRALILSKTDNKPVENDVSIYIYDGNGNKVYSNSTTTSEYGIVSGNFKLADEVNSGTYELKVITETQEASKSFTVNPYIAPKFEASITTDKEYYLVGETAQITVSGKYFFGEPVKGAEVKGMLDDKEVVGLTNDEGNFVTSYEVKQSGKIDIDFSVTDTSNYMVETSGEILCADNLFEVEVVAEYGDIASGINNDIYVITKNIDGTPLKTYTTFSINNISKQVISDENGIGKLTLTPSEVENLSTKKANTFNIVSEDMSGNKVETEVDFELNSTYTTLIKTDKVKYNVGDDIEITLNSRVDLSPKNIYILKNNELIKTISTDEENIKINLEDVCGLVDILVPTRQSSSIYYSKYDNLNYSKRTIFIKPSNSLQIGIETSSDEYKPGDTLNVKFTTKDENNEYIDAALLVSILDEAILSLAENDLSIDNIKLALEDIVLDKGMTAADLYAMVLDDSSEISLKTILLKQSVPSINLIDETYAHIRSYENLLLGLLLLGIIMIIAFINALKKSKNIRKVISNVFIPIVNIIAILILIAIYLSDFIYYYLFVESFLIILATEAVFAIVLYVLLLYKEKDLIFNMIKDFVVIPFALKGIIAILIEIIYSITSVSYSEAERTITILTILVFLIGITILVVKKRNNKLKGKTEKIYNLCLSIIKGITFWIVVGILYEIFEELAFIITIIGYILAKKFIFKETKTKMSDGKIVFNVTSAEFTGMIIGIIMILAVIGVLNLITSFSESVKYDSYIPLEEEFVLDDFDYNSDSSNGSFTFSNIESAVSDTTGTASSSSIFKDTFTFSSDISAESNSKVDEVYNIEEIQNEIEKENEKEENIRNVFLESLAFIPELITENGNVELNTEISDNITTWNIQIVGNTKEGNVGFASSSFKVFKEFFVDFTLPTNSVVTDNVSIPVTLYNYTDNKLAINVNVKDNDWAKIGNYETTVEVPAQSTNMIYVPIEILKDGNNTLRIETSTETLSDIVEKTMVVKPNGLEQNKLVSSGIISEDYSQDIIFDEESIEGTEKVTVKLYASPITQAIENIDAMLKMPTGCFEQTSSSLYPDIFVLKYLRENDISNPELEKKALNYISTGYQRLLTYEVSGEKGGYSLYGESPAEPVITAFGLMEMNDLAEVYEIDENVINNMKEYLFKVQKVNGSFNYRSTYIGNAASTDELAMNAYIIWALSEVCPEDSRLEKSVDYLKGKIDKTSDSYTLALMANVFANVGEKNSANDIIKDLKEKIKISETGAYLASSIRDYYGTRGKYQNIQTTSLASIALTKLGTNQSTNSEFIKYLSSQKNQDGSWGTTQGTILALKAINEYTESSNIKEQTIVLKFNDKEQKVEVNKDSLDVYEFEFDNVSKENHLSIEMKKGKITYEVVKSYYEEYDKLEVTDDIVVKQTIDTKVNVNGIINQVITINNNSEDIENGLLEISIPQGCTPIEESLLQLKYDGVIEKYEYNYGKINIYLRSFSKGKNLDINIKYQALYPEKITGATIKLYDYYNPELEGICMPVQITVTK